MDSPDSPFSWIDDSFTLQELEVPLTPLKRNLLLDRIDYDAIFCELFFLNFAKYSSTFLTGLRLDTNRLNTSHSQRLNSGKPLGTAVVGGVQLIRVQTSPSPIDDLLLARHFITRLRSHN